ncbi:uncharacterized protein [Nerophis lumbriciformis]|uniref:uncharacterized protein isoform X2 n=1 Tax=Nerophis lumbriciformis TaxID=546530 RepID=UPI003BACDD20
MADGKDPLKQLKDLTQLKNQLAEIQKRVENEISAGVPQVHVFGGGRGLSPGACLWRWEEAGVPGGNPRSHGEDMQTPHRKILSPGIEPRTVQAFGL